LNLYNSMKSESGADWDVAARNSLQLGGDEGEGVTDNSEPHYVNCRQRWPECVVDCLGGRSVTFSAQSSGSSSRSALQLSIEQPSLVIQAVITATAAAAATPDSHYRQRSVCVLKTGMTSSLRPLDAVASIYWPRCC